MKSHRRAALRRFVAEHFLPSACIKNTGVSAELILVCKCTPGPERPPLSTSSDEHGASWEQGPSGRPKTRVCFSSVSSSVRVWASVLGANFYPEPSEGWRWWSSPAVRPRASELLSHADRLYACTEVSRVPQTRVGKKNKKLFVITVTLSQCCWTQNKKKSGIFKPLKEDELHTKQAFIDQKPLWINLLVDENKWMDVSIIQPVKQRKLKSFHCINKLVYTHQLLCVLLFSEFIMFRQTELFL